MKKYHITAILFALLLILNFMLTKPNPTIRITTAEELERLFNNPQEDMNVKLASGVYELNFETIIDSTCGNCENPDTLITATVGLIISGKNIKISGPIDRSAVIKTNSGYGLYILNCENCILENLTITGGIRDSSEFATDAAIVVKNSNVIIRNNKITRNYGDQALIKKNIVGIMGICGRENSNMRIYNNLISKNSWDGIALYRNSEAVIEENIIDGVHKAGGRIAQGGRGVGIGVTWNAKVVIRNNLVKRYWKGIGLFVNAEATVEYNIIEDIITWGISLWDAGKGEPRGYINNNIIYKTGAMGTSITSTTEENPGYFKANIIVRTAQDSTYDSPDYYGYQCALAKHLVPKEFKIENNLFYDNRRHDPRLPDYDIALEKFENKLRIQKEWINRITVLESSDFYHDFIE
ncbi:MAG: right-handed parallel beta-helix repeat-containing protein [Candidatus Cloacimonadota bacterium]|nr:right-handed parallel beta-helix repeat-containing protein [Candidatus Cloacimonadota bacterium]